MDKSLVRPRSLVREAASLRAGVPTPAVHVDRLCARIEQVDPLIHAFVPEPGRADRLQAEARALAARHPDPAQAPPLYGVAVGIKDILHVDGLPTHGGSVLPPGVLAGPQATVVDRLRAAGALVAGKTVTAEFAGSAPGRTRNPHRPEHTPGGSSSGSAAAVAAGLVPLAIGTQTIGSVVRPAAYCGVVGFRPTFGRIPTAGVLPNAPSLDTVGLFTADLAGAALAAPLLCDDWDDAAGPDDGENGGAWSDGAPVLGVPVGPYLDRAGPEARQAFDRQLALLAARGLTVRRLDLLPDFDELERQAQTVNRFEMAASHKDWFARFGDLYRPETAASIRHGRTVDPADRAAALRARTAFRERLAERRQRAGVDLLLAPSATGPAPLGLGSTGSAVMSLPWSFAGLPALSLPAGVTAAGLPLGLQVVGEAGADERLLALAAVLEQVLDGG
ncbi:amidase [Kitasatospora purpeofusca]|uniref:amidase n=1 Tax=Kitasatospora purpeofusca TaxID=67352 RepID=UPI00225123BB|nr:amidase [Kitasatospora purpeofusca]MCX4753884.1 amidase [Kitasatospora purpeofusca]WSR33350.1 amidase [Kitasatospora purpeofusca]WSR41421.1 amidase [Kitasatospora purpeofusca]